MQPIRTASRNPLVGYLLMAGLFGLAGCSWLAGNEDDNETGQLPLAGVLSLTVRAADFVNPDVYGRPCPVEVRFFEVNDCQMFRQQRFLDLYNQADRFLGGNLLFTHKFLAVRPGQVIKVNLPMVKGTQCIGALAGYSQFREGTPMTSLAVSESARVKLTVEGLRVVLVRSD